MFFKVGDIVRIATEWCNSEKEAESVFEVIDVNEVTERCVIELKNTNLPLAPTEVVTFSMIERIEDK